MTNEDEIGRLSRNVDETLRNDPEERSSHLPRGETLKSRKVIVCASLQQPALLPQTVRVSIQNRLWSQAAQNALLPGLGGRGVLLTTDFLLMPRLKRGESVSLLPLHNFVSYEGTAGRGGADKSLARPTS